MTQSNECAVITVDMIILSHGRETQMTEVPELVALAFDHAEILKTLLGVGPSRESI